MIPENSKRAAEIRANLGGTTDPEELWRAGLEYIWLVVANASFPGKTYSEDEARRITEVASGLREGLNEWAKNPDRKPLSAFRLTQGDVYGQGHGLHGNMLGTLPKLISETVYGDNPHGITAEKLTETGDQFAQLITLLGVPNVDKGFVDPKPRDEHANRPGWMENHPEWYCVPTWTPEQAEKCETWLSEMRHNLGQIETRRWANNKDNRTIEGNLPDSGKSLVSR